MRSTQPRVSAALDPAFGYWLAGFFDGEGCFVISKAPTEKGCRCTAKIALRADDEPILWEIAERTGLGHVYERRMTRTQRARSRTTAPGAEWQVARKAECLELVGIFERFPLRAKKAHDFRLWAQAVRLWNEIVPGNNVHRVADWTPMIGLRERLIAGRRFEGEGVAV